MRAGAVSLVTEGGEIMKWKDEQREETLVLRDLLQKVAIERRRRGKEDLESHASLIKMATFIFFDLDEKIDITVMAKYEGSISSWLD